MPKQVERNNIKMNMVMKRTLAKKNGKKGFTLVEVIVVLVILAILAAIAIPALTGYIDKAKYRSKITELHDVQTAVQARLVEALESGPIRGYEDYELSTTMTFVLSGVSLIEVLPYTGFVNDLVGTKLVGTWSSSDCSWRLPYGFVATENGEIVYLALYSTEMNGTKNVYVAYYLQSVSTGSNALNTFNLGAYFETPTGISATTLKTGWNLYHWNGSSYDKVN
jgi:prepilin-type N-terminal cleavage/methylation domain-containing protein